MRNISTVVVHHSGTPQSVGLNKSVKSFNRRHKKMLHPKKNSMGYHISYHYVIGPDGNHIKTRGLNEVGYHAGDYNINKESVGICFVGNFNEEHLTEHQIIKFKYLIEELEKKLGGLTITAHRDYKKTSCPGVNISLETLFEKKKEKQGEGFNLVSNGIWNGKRPDEPATRLETAIMIERGLLLQNDVLNDSSKPIENHYPDAALKDNSVNINFADDVLTFEEMRSIPTSKYNYFERIQGDTSLQMNQDEFEDRSNRCTLYAHIASLTHRGIDTTPAQRKALYKWYQDKGFYKDGRGASTIAIAMKWGQAVQETGIYNGDIDTYVFRTGSSAMNFLLFNYNHFFVTSTVMSEHFSNDRKDNFIIDGKIHGGKERGGHAHGRCRISSNMLLWTNSYSNRRNNHAIIEKTNMNAYNTRERNAFKRWVRNQSALHIYL